MSRETPRTDTSNSRSSTRLNAKLDGKLLAYAAATGGSLLGLTSTSEAKIVYTPTHQIISPRTSLKLDLNGDGITDFTLNNNFIPAGRVNTGTSGSALYFYASGAGSANQAVAIKNLSHFARALPGHYQVGPAAKFISTNRPLMERCFFVTGTFNSEGSWNNVKNRFLGLKFMVGGQIHYGWARLSIRNSRCSATALLTGYAYETVAGQAITTGKTSGPDGAMTSEQLLPTIAAPTLGLLANGAPALSIWRREEERIGEIRRSDGIS
jgi:hypothetical protein